MQDKFRKKISNFKVLFLRFILNIRKTLLTLIFGGFYTLNGFGQLSAYYSSATFNTPQNKPFLETYLTIVGKSLASKEIDGKFQNSINIIFKAAKDTVIVKANKYNLLGSAFANATLAPTFIDNQRYSLPNGIYEIELSITDNYDSTKKPLVIKEIVDINYNAKEIQSSSIQIIESYKKTTIPSALTKSGFDLIPYTINYYPESEKHLSFYLEAYNTDTVLGTKNPFLFSYYLENSLDLKKLQSYGSFQKQISSKINPLLAKLDISKLGSGNYNLVIELKDANNITHLQKKFFFQRMNNAVDMVALQNYNEKKNVQEYFGQCTNLDTLKMFVECLWPIAGTVDKERIINQSLKKDADLMKKFVIDFWQRRAADTANPLKLWGNYYKNVQTVMALFKCGKQKGYYTERGRVYLQYGAPSQRTQQKNEQNTFPYEIWQYYTITDATNGQNFTNRKFVFVSKNLGDDCYNMIHSDMRGELYNDRWQFDLTRRNNNGISNPDNLSPAGTENNQFNEIYSNPR